MSYYEKDLKKLSKSKLEELRNELFNKYLVALNLYEDRKNIINVLSEKDNVKKYISCKEEMNKLNNIINEIKRVIDLVDVILRSICKHKDLFVFDSISNVEIENDNVIEMDEVL